MDRLRTIGISLVTSSVMLCSSGFAQTEAPKTDNSKINKRDRMESAKTADSQMNGKTDIQITADIRKAIVADSALSTYAHNVKIVTRHGAVTLKGPVRTAEEKSVVEAKAKEVAGAEKVTSQITVVPEKSGKSMKSAS